MIKIKLAGLPAGVLLAVVSMIMFAASKVDPII